MALGVPLAINLSGRVRAEIRTQAQAQADLVAATAADLLQPGDRVKLAGLARKAASLVRGRVLIVDATGAVLVDSAGPAQVGTSYESRPEIDAALRGRQVQVQRTSRTLGQRILATAVPIIRRGRPAGAVRVTQSVAAVAGAVRRAERGVAVIGGIVVALGLFAGAVIAAHVARPLRRLEQVARRVAWGDLAARAPVEGSREQRSLSSSFNEMTDRIAGLIELQRQFVADASHQLRTPLTGMRLRLEEASGLATDPAQEEELDAALAEVDRVSRTVDELLVLSRAGERPFPAERLDLHTLATAAIERWRAMAQSRGIALKQRADGGSPQAWAAREDIERVLDILVENAIQYSPAGARVDVLTAPARIEVRDRGSGLLEEEREAVFARFHRGRAGIAGPPGSGLGLAIARELARSWEGDVTLEPRPGGGTVAVVTFSQRSNGSDGLPTLNPPRVTVE